MTARVLFLALAVSCLFFTFPDRADAGRGVVLWGQSNDVHLVKDLEGDQGDLGYLYDYFSLFFVNIWTWGGKYVIYEGDGYSDLPTQSPAELATLLGIEESEIKKPITYTIPPGAVILGLLAIVFIALKLKGGNDEEEADEAVPASDE
ncbi:MAG: hypothetical protein AAF517_16625 [Planctomycetota bacterium]